MLVYDLHVSRWNARPDTPDVVSPVIELHFLLPVIVGALVYWWRRFTPERVLSGMMGGAAVFTIDAAAVVGYQATAFGLDGPGGDNERGIEVLTFLSAFLLIGSLFGLLRRCG